MKVSHTAAINRRADAVIGSLRKAGFSKISITIETCGAIRADACERDSEIDVHKENFNVHNLKMKAKKDVA